jgi:hypothetical protein
VNRKQRRVIVEAIRLLKTKCDEAERLAGLVQPLDLGPVDHERSKATLALQLQVTELAQLARGIEDTLASHIGATAILDRAKYPRAKPLSSSKRT